MEKTSLKAVKDVVGILIEHAKKVESSLQTEKKMRYFSTKEVCNFINRTTSTLYKAEEDGVIKKPEVNPDTGRRIGYTLEQVNLLRDHFKIAPKLKRNRPREHLGITTALYNPKGGVGKTTTAVNIAQYCALIGYKVLIIDMDSQASTSAFFGTVGNGNFDEYDTMLSSTLYSEETTLDYAIRETHFDNLQIIRATHHLSSSKFDVYNQVSSDDIDLVKYFQSLKVAVDSVKGNYDFIFLDAPPSLGMNGLQTLLSVDNIIIPCPPRMLDLVVTKQFLEIATQLVDKHSSGKKFHSVKVMVSMYDLKKEESQKLMKIMPAVFGSHMYMNQMLYSESVVNASAALQTVWETPKPDKHTTENMRMLFNEIICDLVVSNRTTI